MLLTEAQDALSSGCWEQALALGQAGEGPVALDIAAEACWWLGRLDDCITGREDAYQRFLDADDDVNAGKVAVRLWEHHLMKLRPAIAGAWLRRGRRHLADHAETVEYGNLVLREAETSHGQGELETATQQAGDVLLLARRLRSADLEAEALQTLGRVLIDTGRVDEGLVHLDEAMLCAVQGRLSPYSTGKVQCSMISACEQLGDLRRAAEWTDATLRWSEAHPRAMWPGICRVHHASLLTARGDWVAAEREARRACEELKGFHDGNVAAGWVEIGEVRRRLGDLAGAEEAFDRSEQLCGQQAPGLALVRLAQDRVEAATALITRLLADQTWNALSRARLLPARVQIAVAAGDLETARAAGEELTRIAADHRSPVLTAAALTACGRVALARGDSQDACASLQQALQHWLRLEVPFEVATTRLLLGQACRGCGDEEAAVRSLAQAAEIFEQLGVRDATALPAGLTGREAEVLTLVAQGRTNRDIAEALFLSERTVARHLSNIFTKIDVGTRTAAAAFAYAHVASFAQNSGSGPLSRRTSAPSETSDSTKPS